MLQHMLLATGTTSSYSPQSGVSLELDSSCVASLGGSSTSEKKTSLDLSENQRAGNRVNYWRLPDTLLCDRWPLTFGYKGAIPTEGGVFARGGVTAK